jgi:hypothetical protein
MAFLQRIVHGKAKEAYPLPEGTIQIGRGTGNDILLTPAAASKRHAQIEGIAGVFRITDLASRNGILVNGNRIELSQELRHGDLLDFAGAIFVYVDSALSVDEESSGDLSDSLPNLLKIHTPMPDNTDPEQSIRRRIVREGDLVSPDDLCEFPQIEGPRVIATIDLHNLPLASWSQSDSTRKVKHIIRLTEAIIAFHDHHRINDVLDILMELFPAASHALIAIEGESADGFRIIGAVSRQVGDAVFLCHPLVRRAITDCSGLLVTDHWRKEQTAKPKLTDLNRQSLLCVPIPGSAQTFPGRTCQGAIQLQANDSGRPFTESDLQRLAVLSHVLGASLPGFRHLA